MSDIYDVILYPDAILKETAHAVDKIDDAIKNQAQKMLDTMYETRGIGLAANQVNILNRMFVIDVNPSSWAYENDKSKTLQVVSTHRDKPNADEAKTHPIVMINPEIVKASEQKSLCLEGCLSLPQQFADVERPAHITVEYVDASGQKQAKDFSGLESHCVQHELDHLNGTLFIDYLSRLKRGTLVRKLEKFKRYEGLL